MSLNLGQYNPVRHAELNLSSYQSTVVVRMKALVANHWVGPAS